MRPSEIREKVLTDHAELRGRLAGLEGLAREVVDGERRLVGALRLEGEELLDRLADHMRWEERYLAPALHDADAWGDERVKRLIDDHREQRDLLADSLSRLRDPSRPPVLLARNVLDLVSLIREDMEDEEAVALDERVLRDDVIAVDAEAG